MGPLNYTDLFFLHPSEWNPCPIGSIVNFSRGETCGFLMKLLGWSGGPHILYKGSPNQIFGSSRTIPMCSLCHALSDVHVSCKDQGIWCMTPQIFNDWLSVSPSHFRWHMRLIQQCQHPSLFWVVYTRNVEMWRNVKPEVSLSVFSASGVRFLFSFNFSVDGEWTYEKPKEHGIWKTVTVVLLLPF